MPIYKPSRESLIRMVNVTLRVPALFIAEIWYRTDPFAVQRQYMIHNKYEEWDKTQEIGFVTAYYLAILLAITLMILPLRRLVSLYMYILSALLLICAHFLSLQYIETEKTRLLSSEQPLDTLVLEDSASIHHLGLYIAAECIISAIISYIVHIEHWHRLFLLAYTLPMIARALSYPIGELHRVHNLAYLIVLLVCIIYVTNKIPVILDLIKTSWLLTSRSVQRYGLVQFLFSMWFRISLPVQFLLFWFVLFGVQLYKYLTANDRPLLSEGWTIVLLGSMGECCTTPFSLIGVCVTISYFSYMLLFATRIFLQGRLAFEDNNIMHQGWSEGFTMFLLAIQTDIIEMKSHHRAFFMSIILFIVFSSLLQSMVEITDPHLLSLGISQVRSKSRHARALFFCFFLCLFPLYMTYTICQYFDVDFWLMVVIFSCVLTSVQIVGSVVVYLLFVYDSHREDTWESLDDLVYYAKASTRILEFAVALFVVCYGMKESLSGNWSIVNSMILVLHCYFNVWQRLQAGWRNYILRRDAASKVASLPVATEHQLRLHNDVCPICFQEMKSASITPCKHLFHPLCLRKWLYIKENCPFCHQMVTMPAVQENTNGVQQQENVPDIPVHLMFSHGEHQVENVAEEQRLENIVGVQRPENIDGEQ